MAQQPLVLRYAARSDVGRVRAKNDDSAYAGRYLAVVADGMGGHAGGDVASASTVLDLIHLDHDGYTDDAGTHLADEIQTANSLLSELVHVNPKLAGMGTTVTALLLSGRKLHLAHIGDSRAYRLKHGVYEQISVDHTFVQRLIDEGRLHPSEAETHPHKNVLMRVLGDVDASPELDLTTFDVEPGERWLLCSDGLNFVHRDVVEDVLRSTKDLGECADRLVELTLEAGAPDNVTVVVFEVHEPSAEELKTARLATVPLPAAADKAVADKSAMDKAAGDKAAAETAGADKPAVKTSSAVEAAPSSSPAGSAVQANDASPDGNVAHTSDAAGADGTTVDEEVLGAHITAEGIRQELADRPHELVGAAVTAAAEGTIPTISGRSAARRAAMVLTHKTEAARREAEAAEAAEAADDDAAEPLPAVRSRRLLLAVIGTIVLVVALIGLGLGYAWTQSRYYVGQSNGHVAIYNGVSQSLGPIPLSHVYTETSLKVSSLPAFSQQQVQQTLPASNLDDAKQIVSNLQLGSTDPRNCTPGPSASATSTSSGSSAAPGPSSSAAPSPAPTSGAATQAATPSGGASNSPPPNCSGGGK